MKLGSFLKNEGSLVVQGHYVNQLSFNLEMTSSDAQSSRKFKDF